MQVVLIITALVISILAFCLCIFRAKKLNVASEAIYDPKLRITACKSISVWIFMIFCIASLISLIWLFGLYGRLYNYEGGFTLKPAASWRLIENDAGNAEQYHYMNTKNDGIRINIVSLDREDAKEKRAEIKQTKNRMISASEEAEERLKVDAESAEKELKSQAKAKEKELKAAFKGDRQQRKAAVKENKEQLKTDIENTKSELELNLANNKENRKNIWRNGWLKRDIETNNFIALRHGRLYTVDVTLRKNLSALSIGPAGFFAGIFDGSTFSFMFFIAKNNNSLHPYKTINNGISYLLGFILGSVVFLAFVAWLVFVAAMKISREHWKKKWLIMSTSDKVAYMTILYEKEQEINKDNLKAAEQESKNQYAQVNEKFDATPDNALEILNAPPKEKGKLEKTGNFLANAFTAGGFSKKIAEEQYNDMKMVYDYFDSLYKIAFANVKIANTRYNYICRIAGLYILQMKELIASFNYKQKEQFIQAEQMELGTVEFNGLQEQELLDSIKAFHKDFNIKTKAMWKGTLKFVNAIGDVSSLGNLGPALGVGAIVVAGAVHYFGIINKNNKIKAMLIKARAKIRDAITESKKNKSKAESFVKRAEEICDYLDDSMKHYAVMFEGISAQLFPDGDTVKSKLQRHEREKKGDGYYTDEEFMIIRPLGKYAKAMGQLIEADL